MSIKVISAVLDLPPGVVSPPERLVLIALAWHADEYGLNSWPAVGTIARKTSLTRRAVQKILHRLTQKALIYVQSVAARGSVRYAVDLQALDRARHAQSKPVDCERRSQSEPSAPFDCEPRSQSEPVSAPLDCEPRSPHCEPRSRGGRTTFAGGGEPRSPDPSFLTVLEPSLKKSPSLRDGILKAEPQNDDDEKNGGEALPEPVASALVGDGDVYIAPRASEAWNLLSPDERGDLERNAREELRSYRDRTSPTTFELMIRRQVLMYLRSTNSRTGTTRRAEKGHP